MNIIVAIDENWAIGYKNDLLIKIKEDMKHFKQKTMNNIVVMGRLTFESLPEQKPLKNRINIVLTRDCSFKAEGTTVCHDIETVLSIAKAGEKETFIIGGEQIYKLFIPYCKKAFITKIYHSFKADKYIPNFINSPDWEMIEESELFEADESIKYQFLVYKKI